MKIHKFKLVSLATLFSFSCFGQNYDLTDLGGQIGSNSYAQGINNQGQVVGYWDSTNGAHAFLYQNGTVTDLGLLGATNNYALSINDQGQIVGYAETTNGARAFLYQEGGMTNLGSLGGSNSYAFGINASGQIVGYVAATNGVRAMMYDGGSSTTIGTLGGTNSFGYGINSSRQVVGSSLLTNNLDIHPFLWENGSMADLNQISIVNGSWQLIDARGINGMGDIAGWGFFNNEQHAYLFYHGGLPIDLGTLAGGTNSYALGINNSNQIVGASSSGAGTHAVTWQNGAIKDLNDMVSAYGWVLREAYGINDFGQIVGWGVANGQARAFMLTPKAASGTSSVGIGQSFGFHPLLVPGGAGFTVTLTNPVNNSSFSAPGDLTISATTSDSYGTVTQVQFYAGGMLLGVKTSSPWSLTWSNMTVGLHSLLAIARDDAGLFATSSIVSINISTNLPPIADSYVRGGSFTFYNFGTSPGLLCWTPGTADNTCIIYFKFDMAGLTNVTSAKLSVYASVTPLAAVYVDVKPSNTNWTENTINWNNQPGGGSALTVNTLGASAWYYFNISSFVQSQPAGQPLSVALSQPSVYSAYVLIYSKENSSLQPYLAVQTSNTFNVSITSPSNNNTFFTPTNITISANATVQDGNVANVQFFAGARLIGTATNAPYSMVWSNVPVGTYALTAVASDGVAICVTSSVVKIFVSTILSPLADAHVQDGIYTNTNFGTNIVMEDLTATTNGENRDIYYKFALGGFAGTISSASLNVFGSAGAGGPVTNTVYSVTDTNWTETGLTWSNKPALTGPLTTNVIASTNWYVFDVTAYAKSQKLAGQTLISMAMHDPTNAIQLVTINSKENSTNPPVLVITTTNAPPSVSILSPTNNCVLAAPNNVNIMATASDDDTVAQVEFFQGDTSLGIFTNSPYSLVWSNVDYGTYTLTARATDNFGLVTTSSVVTLIVDALPSVALTNPANHTLILAGSNIALGASAGDVDGTVAQVQFFQGTTSLGIKTNTPYSLTWSNVSSGSYALTVQATDNNGLVSTSSVVNVNVDAPPTISITSPTNGSMFAAPASLGINISAADSDGTVTQAQLYVGNVLLQSTNGAFNFSLSSVPAGLYVFHASATDNLGLASTSSVVNVRVGSYPDFRVLINRPTGNVLP